MVRESISIAISIHLNTFKDHVFRQSMDSSLMDAPGKTILWENQSTHLLLCYVLKPVTTFQLMFYHGFACDSENT
jgi:hypothetical protein